MYVVLPPLRFVGLCSIGFVEHKYKELVHLQQERVSAVLREETSQQSALSRSKGLLILPGSIFKWILQKTNKIMNSPSQFQC